MSNKARLISTISAICMVLALLTVGVWAVSTASVTLGGSVSFTADNVHARITGSVTGTQETITLPNLEYDVNTDVNATDFQSKLSSWANNQMTFTSENLITMTITVENLSEERSLFVTLTDNTTTTNVGKTLKQGASNYTSATAVEVTAGNTTTFTMTLSVTDKNQSASATVAYQVDLRDANAEVEESFLKHDTKNDYYYVEMGEYQGTPVRWRVVGVNGEHYTYNENQAPTGELTFIQETETTTYDFGYYEYVYEEDEEGNIIKEEEEFYNDNSNDYSVSYLREYITGIDCSDRDISESENYLAELGIDETDAIYKKITARSIIDLYTDINWSNTTISDGTPTVEDKTTSDKLWIPSVAEIYSLVGGGDTSTISNSWSTEIKNNLIFYAWSWLRSPDPDYSFSAYTIDNFGGGYGNNVDYDNAVRPMFLLEV